MELEFSGDVWHWRGPAPHHFVWVPEDDAAQIGDVAAAVTYGWGMIPVTATVGATTWTTSLFPKDGGYLVPIKDKIRKTEGLDLDSMITIRLTLAI